MKSWKKIIHPGEVNKMREFRSRPTSLVTHTDAPELLFWNTGHPAAPQDHRRPSAPDAKDERARRASSPPSKPDLVLVGHEENAEFALAVRRETFDVASGGKDQKVLLWSIEDHDAAKAAVKSGAPRRAALYDGAAALAPKLRSRTRGHRGGRRVPPRPLNLSCAASRATLAHLLGRPREDRDPRTG